MEFLSPLWNYVIPFLVILTLLVFVHEMGHYYIARRNGVRVETFSIGFGPELFGWHDKRGTRWRFAVIPLGGYVKMFGETGKIVDEAGNERGMSTAERALSFHHKTVWQRAAIVFAGPFINYLFAVVVLAALFAIAGQSYSPPVVGALREDGAAAKAGLRTGDRVLRINGKSIDRFEDILQIVSIRPGGRFTFVIERNNVEREIAVVADTKTLTDRRGNTQDVGEFGFAPLVPSVIGRVIEGSAAEAAGIRVGDRILRINGQLVETFEDLRRIVSVHPGIAIEIELQRGGQSMVLSAVPRPQTTGERTIGLIGVGPEAILRRETNPLAALGEAVRETYDLTLVTFTAIGQMFAGTRSTKDISGPLRIAEISGDMAQTGLYSFFWFLGVLSLHLCIINLLPVPMLDGGHLVFYGIEAVRGKPLGQRAQEYGFRIGLALVISLMVFATWNDLVHLRVVAYVKGLFG
jgi:regulator of sigma E protease